MLALSFLLIAATCNALSTKKGICVSPETFKCNDLDHFTNIHWWYDWTLFSNYRRKLHCSHIKPGHIPMVWGSASLNARNIQALPNDTQIVLGFNEPNIKNQANLMPDKAAQLWKELERLNPGKTLVGPAASQCTKNCTVGDAKHWFIEFFKYCQGCKVDYLATHAYYCDAHRTMNILHDLWTTFQKPIWLTEFSCPQTHSAHKQLVYMQQLLPQLESAHYVHRYSWFSHRYNSTWITSSTNLVHLHNNQLTALGRFYNNF